MVTFSLVFFVFSIFFFLLFLVVLDLFSLDVFNDKQGSDGSTPVGLVVHIIMYM